MSLTPDIPYREMEESVELSHIAHPESEELLTINFGPHHPATHGVLRLMVTLEAEVVRDVRPVIGYLHTGIEKTAALDLGAISMFWYCFRDREQILDLFEMSSGQRMHTRYFQVGGVFEDIPVGWEQKVRAFTKIMPERVDQFLAILKKNEIVLQRLRGVAPLDEETLLAHGVTGPLLRAAGNPWDLRKAAPYCSYEHFDFKIPVGTVGDNWDRMIVRIMEILECCRIVDQALDGLPEGPYITPDRKYALPPRHELATSMEALIHHFKLVTEGFRVPPGEFYYPIESPRGEMGCFVRADGSSKPARVHMRDPSFVNLQSFRPMVRDLYIADFIATLGMLDPVLGGVDR
jgi:NADH-quinone oxidoreductase subunit D